MMMHNVCVCVCVCVFATEKDRRITFWYNEKEIIQFCSQVGCWNNYDILFLYCFSLIYFND